MERQTFRILAGVCIAAAFLTPDVKGQGPGAPAAPTATTLTVSPNPSPSGESVTLTARVALVSPGPNAPTGDVEFFDVDTSLGTATLSSASPRTATLVLTSLGSGPHSISAKYLGDSSCADSRSPIVAHVVIGH
jgi:hypothetical protein